MTALRRNSYESAMGFYENATDFASMKRPKVFQIFDSVMLCYAVINSAAATATA